MSEWINPLRARAGTFISSLASSDRPDNWYGPMRAGRPECCSELLSVDIGRAPETGDSQPRTRSRPFSCSMLSATTAARVKTRRASLKTGPPSDVAKRRTLDFEHDVPGWPPCGLIGRCSCEPSRGSTSCRRTKAWRGAPRAARLPIVGAAAVVTMRMTGQTMRASAGAWDAGRTEHDGRAQAPGTVDVVLGGRGIELPHRFDIAVAASAPTWLPIPTTHFAAQTADERRASMWGPSRRLCDPIHRSACKS